MPIGLNLVYAPLAGRNLPVAGTMTEALAPLLIVNPYGLFATTTTTRPVIVFEGSDDNKTWREYALPYLPGPVDRAPAWSIPYQPRLDWQLWFAAYGSAAQNRWIERLLQRLLEGSPDVLVLFSETPFDDPAAEVRARAALRLSLRGCEHRRDRNERGRGGCGASRDLLSVNVSCRYSAGRGARRRRGPAGTAMRRKPRLHAADAIA